MDLGNVRPIAKGCAGSNNKTPTMVYGGSPYRGNSSFRLQMEGGMPNALVHAVLGLARLDVDLTVIGAPGSVLHPQITLDLFSNLNAQGGATLPAPIPVNTSLLGFKLLVQFGVADAEANAAGLTTFHAYGLLVR